MLHSCSLENFSSSYPYGGKANGLHELYLNKLPVPESIFIEATDDPAEVDCPSFQRTLFQHLEAFKTEEDLYDLAIRSSALNEDGANDSFAGHYDTILGLICFEDVLAGIKQVLLSQEKGETSSSNKMGVVIQPFIRADYSGVLFSSSPFTFSKKECIVSFTDGCGDKLVSGEEAGTDVLVTLSEKGWSLPHEQVIPFGEQKLFELCQKVKELERVLGYPIDVEWTLKENIFTYIQCRPLTSITKIPSTTVPVTAEYLDSIPKQLLKSDKVSLRIDAQKKNTHVSDAYVIVSNTSSTQEELASLETIKRSPLCHGYSAVVIYPKLISEKVVRSFIGDTDRINLNSLEDSGSTMNTAPKYSTIEECVAEFVTMANDDFWVSSIIIQEIYSPKFTGVVKKEGENTIIEIIKGHFFTKGTIPASSYLVSREGTVLSKHEVCQEEWYEISEGAVIQHTDKSNQKNCLTEEEIQRILKEFDTFLQEQEALIEFGLLEINDTPKPYLIDLVKNSEDLPELTSKDISQGILSHGKRTGKLLYVDLTDEESFDLHFHNAFNEENKPNDGENLIFACKKTSIELLRFIYANKPENIGFLFESGSILCHLSIVLRENEIPAIQIGSFDALDLEYGANYTIDAESEQLTKAQRVQKLTY
ncbi:PEP/pyruvate-binding domain-containing protein [Enterococcus gilvus]|uniref:PEP/pyruvate-binding domain-containing protein n=1 Tax=Enterococcus gilvus TaxID=160453 RepID=UPI003D6C5A1F